MRLRLLQASRELAVTRAAEASDAAPKLGTPDVKLAEESALSVFCRWPVSDDEKQALRRLGFPQAEDISEYELLQCYVPYGRTPVACGKGKVRKERKPPLGLKDLEGLDGLKTYMGLRDRVWGSRSAYHAEKIAAVREFETSKGQEGRKSWIHQIGEGEPEPVRKALYPWLRRAYRVQGGVTDLPAFLGDWRQHVSPKLKKVLEEVDKELREGPEAKRIPWFDPGKGNFGWVARPMKVSEGGYALDKLSKHALGTAYDIAADGNPQLSMAEWKFAQRFSGVSVSPTKLSKKTWRADPGAVWDEINKLNDAFVRALRGKVREELERGVKAAPTPSEEIGIVLTKLSKKTWRADPEAVCEEIRSLYDAFVRAPKGKVREESEGGGKAAPTPSKEIGIVLTKLSKKNWRADPGGAWEEIRKLYDALVRALEGEVCKELGGGGKAAPASTEEKDIALTILRRELRREAQSQKKTWTKQDEIKLNAKMMASKLCQTVQSKGIDHGFFDLEKSLVVALGKRGLIWGATFSTNIDLMHFELP